MNHLTPEQVLFIHSRLVTETGGSHGLRDLALLESAVARPRATFDSKELYPDWFTKAAAPMDVLINNHPFWDGNKRTGITATGLFFRINGWKLTAASEELGWPDTTPCAWQWKVWRLMNLPIGFWLKPILFR